MDPSGSAMDTGGYIGKTMKIHLNHEDDSVPLYIVTNIEKPVIGNMLQTGDWYVGSNIDGPWERWNGTHYIGTGQIIRMWEVKQPNSYVATKASESMPGFDIGLAVFAIIVISLIALFSKKTFQL